MVNILLWLTFLSLLTIAILFLKTLSRLLCRGVCFKPFIKALAVIDIDILLIFIEVQRYFGDVIMVTTFKIPGFSVLLHFFQFSENILQIFTY
jgi:hypothetical protein